MRYPRCFQVFVYDRDDRFWGLWRSFKSEADASDYVALILAQDCDAMCQIKRGSGADATEERSDSDVAELVF